MNALLSLLVRLEMIIQALDERVGQLTTENDALKAQIEALEKKESTDGSV